MAIYPQAVGYDKLNPATAQASAPLTGDDYLNDEQLLTKYKSLIQMSLDGTSEWRSKQDQWHKQRMCVKKKKVFPYEGCSNLKMPTIERHIRKKKAKLANRIFGIRPIVQAVPPPSGNPQTSQRIEKFVDHLLMDVMNVYPKFLIALDKMLESGFSVLKSFWRIDITKRYETFGLEDMSVEDAAMMFSHGTDPDWIKEEIVKRLSIDMNPMVAEENEKAIEDAIVKLYQGADEVTIDVQDIIYNAPDVAIPDVERIIVPPESPLDPKDCEWKCHDMIIPFRVFKTRTSRGYKNIDVVNDLLARSAADPNFMKDQTKDTREGIQRFQASGDIRVQELYTWEKLNEGDVEPRKCIITICPDFNVVCRRISADGIDGEDPFSRINNEIIDDRWFSSRGIPEIITDIAKEIDTQKNQRIDSQTARNAPMWMYRVGIMNPQAKLKPNKGIPVPAGVPFGEAFAMVNNTNLNAEYSYKDEMMMLNAETEELLGEVNFTLQSQINKRQPRTGTEVEQQVNNSVPSSNIEADMVMNGFNDFVQKVFALWCKNGDDQVEFQYFGPDANGQFETIKLSKEELQGHLITLRGNDANTNPDKRIQKAITIKQMVNDPVSLQMGITTPMNVYNANREFFQQMGVNPDLYVSPPAPPPPPPLPKINLAMEDMTPMEQMQIKQRMGIQPDVPGNIDKALSDHRKKKAETAKIEAETESEKISEPAPRATT